MNKVLIASLLSPCLALLVAPSVLPHLSPEFAPLAHRCCSPTDDLLAQDFLAQSSVSAADLDAALPQRERRVAQLLQRRLRLTDSELLRVLVRHPYLLDYSFEQNVAPTLDTLQRSLALQTEELKKLVQGAPQLLGLNVDGTTVPRLAALRELLALDVDGLRRMLLRVPSLTNLSVEDNLAPKLRVLQDLLALSEEEVRSLVVRYPQILSLSVDDNVRPKLDALRRLLTDDDAELGGAVMDPVADAAAATESVRNLVLRYPTVLGLSTSRNLEPKLAFLATSLSWRRSTLRGAVLSDPAVLGASLERSLRPNVNLWHSRLLSEAQWGESEGGSEGGGQAETELEAGAAAEADTAAARAASERLGAMALRHGLRFLYCSFEKRTVPRIERALEAGVDPFVVVTRLRYTEARFDAWLQQAAEAAGGRSDEAGASSASATSRSSAQA